MRSFASDGPTAASACASCSRQTFPRFKEFEPQLRAAAQLSLEQWALERAGLLEEEPYRRGHRVRILEHALAPLAPQLPPAVRDRLHRALSVVYGIEPYVILKDIWGLRRPRGRAHRAVDGRRADRCRAARRRPLPRRAAQARGPDRRAKCRPRPAARARMSAPARCRRGRAAAPSPAWFDAQYNNRARIPEHLQILEHWADASARGPRARCRRRSTSPTAATPSERLDIFPAAAPRAPVLVYIHGGYWRALDKRDQSFVAPPFVDAGAMVVRAELRALPGRDASTTSCSSWCRRWPGSMAPRRGARRRPGAHRRGRPFGRRPPGGDAARLRLARRRAGPAGATWCKAALSISGVFELEPLRHAPFLAPDLRLDAAVGARASARRGCRRRRGPLCAVVGGDESEEFLRQNDADRDGLGRGRRAGLRERARQRNHMDVLYELADPGARLHRLALSLLGLGLALARQRQRRRRSAAAPCRRARRACSLSLSACSARVSASLGRAWRRAPPQSMLSIAIRPPGRSSSQAALVVGVVAGLVGVDEGEVVAARPRPRRAARRACRAPGRARRSILCADAGLLPERPADARVLVADVAGEHAAVGGQRQRDRERAVAGEDADLDRAPRADAA